jgi:hypothetical protein
MRCFNLVCVTLTSYSVRVWKWFAGAEFDAITAAPADDKHEQTYSANILRKS